MLLRMLSTCLLNQDRDLSRAGGDLSRAGGDLLRAGGERL